MGDSNENSLWNTMKNALGGKRKETPAETMQRQQDGAAKAAAIAAAAESKRKAEIAAKAKCPVTEENPAGICFNKKGGSIKLPKSGARTASRNKSAPGW